MVMMLAISQRQADLKGLPLDFVGIELRSRVRTP